MKSKTSFFNATIFRKDITRFYPVWLAYSLVACLGLLEDLNDSYLYYSLAENVCSSISTFTGMSVWFAPVVALLLFSDLFKPRQCNGLHALPVRRETLFCTHALSGALFILVPNLICALVYMVNLGAYWYLAFTWLGATTLSFLCLYGVALFSVVLSGTKFASVLVYLGVNFLTYILAAVYYILYEPLLYGLSSSGDLFNFFSPVMMVSLSTPVGVILSHSTGAVQQIVYLPSAWLWLGIYALLGLALAAVGLLCYRKRHLESAGDFLSAAWVKPIFTLGFSLGFGLVLYLWSYVFENEGYLPVFFLFLAIGYFASQMLLRRTVKVFQKRTWLGLGALAAAIALTLGLTALDPLGITSRVPEASQVKAVSINDSTPFTQEEDVQKVIALHRAILEQRELNEDAERAANANDYFYIGSIGMHSVTLEYTLSGNKTLLRTYNVPLDSPAGKEHLGALLSTPEYVLHDFTDWDSFVSSLKQITVTYEGPEISKDQWPQLLESLKQDFKNGNMAQHEFYHSNKNSITSLTFWVLYGDRGSSAFGIDLWDDSLTLQWLKDNGYYPLPETK